MDYEQEQNQVQSRSFDKMDHIQEVKGWNWGAFMFNWIWGIGNKTYLPLLCFVPILNIIMIFVCGAKGNEWAWKKGDYRDVETFKAVQKTWNRAGIVYLLFAIIVIIIYIAIIAMGIASLHNDPSY